MAKDRFGRYEQEPPVAEPTPGFGPDGQPKPYFPEGTRVSYNLGVDISGVGTIRGLVMQHVIDIWIVERSEVQDPDVYPYSCITVPHTLLKLA